MLLVMRGIGGNERLRECDRRVRQTSGSVDLLQLPSVGAAFGAVIGVEDRAVGVHIGEVLLIVPHKLIDEGRGHGGWTVGHAAAAKVDLLEPPLAAAALRAIKGVDDCAIGGQISEMLLIGG